MIRRLASRRLRGVGAPPIRYRAKIDRRANSRSAFEIAVWQMGHAGTDNCFVPPMQRGKTWSAVKGTSALRHQAQPLIGRPMLGRRSAARPTLSHHEQATAACRAASTRVRIPCRDRRPAQSPSIDLQRPKSESVVRTRHTVSRPGTASAGCLHDVYMHETGTRSCLRSARLHWWAVKDSNLGPAD